jgi:hypothetical protein
MDREKVSRAIGIIWTRLLRSTQTPIQTSQVTELKNALAAVEEEADENDVLGRRLTDFCDQLRLSKVFDARREPATGMEALIRTCESLQMQLKE